MVQEELAAEDQAGGLSMGAIMATAIAAGVIAYVIRRARLPNEARVRGSGRAHWADKADLRWRTAAATREFVTERILPEMKPALLDLLKDAKAYVDQGFKRVEKAIREF